MTDELIKKELLESAREMGLDIEWYSKEILEDENCLSLVRRYFTNE